MGSLERTWVSLREVGGAGGVKVWAHLGPRAFRQALQNESLSDWAQLLALPCLGSYGNNQTTE